MKGDSSHNSTKRQEGDQQTRFTTRSAWKQIPFTSNQKFNTEQKPQHPAHPANTEARSPHIPQKRITKNRSPNLLNTRMTRKHLHFTSHQQDPQKIHKNQNGPKSHNTPITWKIHFQPNNRPITRTLQHRHHSQTGEQSKPMTSLYKTIAFTHA